MNRRLKNYLSVGIFAFFGGGLRAYLNLIWSQTGTLTAKKGIINKWLVDNCFGDYYTRKGLDDKEREMITFCYLAAQGGCEPQLLAHAKANVGLGNDQQFLTKIVLANVPFIGYPRSLNAINVINQVK